MRNAHQLVKNRPRVAIAVLVGCIVASALPTQWRFITRTLVAWNVAVWSYLLIMGWLMAHATHAKVRKIAEQEEKGALTVLIILSFAATVSLAAVIVELTTSKGLPGELRLLHYLFAGATVLGSWCLVGVIFTFHYAYLFYRAPAHQRPLRFPCDEENPDYWDFLYFSFTIAVAAQTSDVVVITRSMRKVVLAQSILGFFYNVAIVGFSVNIAAGVVGA